MIGHYTIFTNRAVNFSSFLGVPLLYVRPVSEPDFQLEVWATATFDSIACWSVSIIAYLTCLLWIGLACPVHAYTNIAVNEFNHLEFVRCRNSPRRSNSRSSENRVELVRENRSRINSFLVRPFPLLIEYIFNSKKKRQRPDSNPRPWVWYKALMKIAL